LEKKRKESFLIQIVDYGEKDGSKMKFSFNKIWSAGPGSQWMRKAKRELWHEEVWRILDDLNIKPFKNKVDITFEFFFKSRFLDSSNCAPMVKLIEDSLVENGVIKNDTNDLVGWLHIRSEQVEKKERALLENDYVRVTLEEA